MRLLLLLILCGLALQTRATEQIPDNILVDGEQYSLLTRSPFEALLIRPDINSALNKRVGLKSTNNWRGYIATWEIRGKRLLLRSMTSGGRSLPLNTFFLGRDSPIDAVWLSGTLLLGKGKAIRAQDSQFFKPDIDHHYTYGRTLRYDSYLKIKVENGYVQAREDYEPTGLPDREPIAVGPVVPDSEFAVAFRLTICQAELERISKEQEALSARLKNDCPSVMK